MVEARRRRRRLRRRREDTDSRSGNETSSLTKASVCAATTLRFFFVFILITRMGMASAFSLSLQLVANSIVYFITFLSLSLFHILFTRIMRLHGTVQGTLGVLLLLSPRSRIIQAWSSVSSSPRLQSSSASLGLQQYHTFRTSNNKNNNKNKYTLSLLQSTSKATDASITSSTAITSTSTASSSSSSSSSAPLPHAYIAEQSRPDFDILHQPLNNNDKPLVYLDSAATSQKPKVVLQALQHFYQRDNANVHRGAHTLSRQATAAYEHARDVVATFINANSRNEIVFCSGATEGLNLLASCLGKSALLQLEAGDEILLTEIEHHANLVPWQLLQEEKQVVLKFIPLNLQTGVLDIQQLQLLQPSLLSNKTKIVSFQHVSNVLGCIHPVHEMVQMIRKHAHPNVKIILDACQSVPHMPMNVQELGVDFLVASGHKLCGPTGIGFVWGKYEHLNALPPYKGGGEMIDQVTLQKSTWQPAPARFEAGTPAIAQAVGLGVAMEYLTSIGMDKIEAYEHELGNYLFEQLNQVPGITILGPQDGTKRAALCAFVHESIHSSDLSSFLDIEGVAVRAGHHCCQPLHQIYGYSHSARASLYLYNTKE